MEEKIIKLLKLCREALDSCGDNYGSESADNGEYEQYFDDTLIDTAKEEISKYLKKENKK